MKSMPAIYSVIFLLFVLVDLPVYADAPPPADPNLTSLVDQTFNDNSSISNLKAIVSDLFTGSLSYSIPISVPAGRKGMQPKLALTYKNTNPNGWLGQGGSLNLAISKETRKRAWIIMETVISFG